MQTVSMEERRHLELAFDSSYGIVKLSGLEGGEELAGLREQIIAGELSFDEAVRVVLSVKR
ncbi:hypothetical protein [Massilia sp. LC238]|uniref:hypothetical protein n=1 Tax=Massilia sp. LC238 TaxID=1502852 RepID=UPI0004E33B92|nr:hypothetical protein [Massilia sp. LC238]KFC76193.1 hypothetical protein FG94_00285 [Massilia sp. LC238]